MYSTPPSTHRNINQLFITRDSSASRSMPALKAEKLVSVHSVMGAVLCPSQSGRVHMRW